MNQIITVGEAPFALNLRLHEAGMPEIISFGDTVEAHEPLAGITRASRINGMDEAVPSNVILPTGGLGYFGWPAIAGHRQGRDFLLDFSDWKVLQTDNQTRLSARDTVAQIAIQIEIASHAGGVISMASRLTNEGTSPYQLDRCMAGTFRLPAGQAWVEHFTGSWGREFQTRREKLGTALWVQENRRGRTSHDRPPMLFVESGGLELGLTLGWSGNHQVAVDCADDGARLVHLGALFEPGECLLAPGETYESPRAYAGADVASLHAFVREELLDWPDNAMKPRPVTLNTWEGNYFDHRLDALKAQASAAAELGIERFVLDDGWFGRRDDDTSSLGDWDIDPRKYPSGLKPLVDHVTGLGMEFGIWFEPEMINPNSELFRTYPDWALQAEGRPLLLSRNQLVLDLTRPEVSDYLFNKMHAVLSTHDISYIKWDMNRDLTHVAGRDGRARTDAQTRAVYALMDRIRAAHPDVEIESCASGGGRVDYGVLARTHRVWASDCTDALERLEIQRGISRFLPPEIVGSHVSAVPNHQTGRRHSLSFRAIVAMAYHFGVELNPLEMTEGERAELAGFIEAHKRLRPVLHASGANFFCEPLDGRYLWGAAIKDKIVLFIAQATQAVSEQPAPLRLPEKLRTIGGAWRITNKMPEHPAFIRIHDDQKRLLAGEISFSLDAAISGGLPLPMMMPESALLLELDREDN